MIDIRNANTPAVVGSIQDTIRLYSALYVRISGGYAYVTSPGGTFSVIEIVGVSP